MAQYVYTMNRVGKIVPPKRQILKDISLSFFPGAKIGVLGLNGSGKSSLLRIMAGIDKEYEGEAQPMPNLRIGYLPQEPQLDPAKDVRGNVQEGVGGTLALIARFNAISDRFAEPMDDEEMSKLLEEQGELRATIPPGSSRRKSASPRKREQNTLRKTLEKELEWVRTEPEGRQAKSKARLRASRSSRRRNSRNATRPTRSTSRPASGSATWWSRRRTCARPSAIDC
jgi:energy-coupling factor transporter ATP-binding protein EcfA2